MGHPMTPESCRQTIEGRKAGMTIEGSTSARSELSIARTTAEAFVIGAAMNDPEQWAIVEPVLTGVTFSDPRDRFIAKAMLTCHAKGEPIDLINIVANVHLPQPHEEAGFSLYLQDRAALCAEPEFTESYCRQLIEHQQRQTLRAILSDKLRRLDGEPASNIVEDVSREVADVCKSARSRFNLVFASDLLAQEPPPKKWIAKGIIRELAITFLTGPSKSLKTSLGVNIGVSVATGTECLGRFETEQRRVLMLLGETPADDLYHMILRALEAKGLERSDIGDNLAVQTCDTGTMPQVSSRSDLMSLRRAVNDHRAGLVISDPLYLMAEGLDFAKLSEVGPRIRALADAVAPATLLVMHHTTKGESRQTGKVLDMSSGSGVGLHESCGGWICVNRESEFDPSASEWHELNASYGGRGGHGGRLLVRFNETTGECTSEPLGSNEGRDCEKREEQEQRKASQKITRRETQLNSARAYIGGLMRDARLPIASQRALERAIAADPASVSLPREVYRTAFSGMVSDLTVLKCKYRINSTANTGFVMRDDLERFRQLDGFLVNENGGEW